MTQFTGKERDIETGLDYFGARYYGSNLGRWLSPDWNESATPVPYADFSDPQTLNLYGYVHNNPLTHADADGHCFWDLCVGEATAVYITGAAIMAAAAYIYRDQISQGVTGLANASKDAANSVANSQITLSPAASSYPGVDNGPVMQQRANTSGTQGDSKGQSSANAGPKAKDAPGVTAGGQATNEHGQKLGPSGKPQVNNVDKNTREAANNAANKGSGTVEHTNPTRGGPHFHTKRGDGTKKQDNTHYNYPN